MAKQDPHPSSWFETDGCSGVLDFTAAIKQSCDTHDVGYHWGGPAASDKQRLDTEFYKNLSDAGWLGHLLAPGRYRGVRQFTWNTPPRQSSLAGPQERRYDTMWEAIKHGQTRVEAFNWLGPGRGIHAGMEAQGSKDSPQLLPEQMPEVSAWKGG